MGGKTIFCCFVQSEYRMSSQWLLRSACSVNVFTYLRSLLKKFTWTERALLNNYWDDVLQTSQVVSYSNADNTLHRDAFCKWIYYCNSSKSTRKETDKTHRCGMDWSGCPVLLVFSTQKAIVRFFCIFLQKEKKTLSNVGDFFSNLFTYIPIIC